MKPGNDGTRFYMTCGKPIKAVSISVAVFKYSRARYVGLR